MDKTFLRYPRIRHALAIDVIGLDAEMRVVKRWQNVRPQQVTHIAMSVRSVIKLAAGEIDASSIHVGNILKAVSPIRTEAISLLHAD